MYKSIDFPYNHYRTYDSPTIPNGYFNGHKTALYQCSNTHYRSSYEESIRGQYWTSIVIYRSSYEQYIGAPIFTIQPAPTSLKRP